jgi:16S rRNA C967 or C1407 C5-methylase (RsmB/RsmF family)
MGPGGTPSAILQDLAIQIQELCNKHNITAIYQHIPGIQNTQADALSRIKRPVYESAIPKKMFCTIQKKWGKLTIDAFAARHNQQLPRYWTLTEDPAAAAVDAFRETWSEKRMYLYPPWKLIPQVIKMIQKQRLHKVVLETPLWPSQFWYPMILEMRHLQPPYFGKSTKNGL